MQRGHTSASSNALLPFTKRHLLPQKTSHIVLFIALWFFQKRAHCTSSLAFNTPFSTISSEGLDALPQANNKNKKQFVRDIKLFYSTYPLLKAQQKPSKQSSKQGEATKKVAVASLSA